MATQQQPELVIETNSIKKAALIFRALNHKLRQSILQLIHKKGTITVTEIYRKLNLEQSVASQHLGILRKAGLVIAKRDRRFIFYSVNYENLKDIQKQASRMVEKEAASPSV